MSNTEYIELLPERVQREIAEELERVGIEGEDFERAMSSRVCDLEDTVDVRRWI